MSTKAPKKSRQASALLAWSLRQQGSTEREIAEVLGVHTRTVQRLFVDFPELSTTGELIAVISKRIDARHELERTPAVKRRLNAARQEQARAVARAAVARSRRIQSLAAKPKE